MSHSDLVLEAQSVKLMFQIIDQMTESVKVIEKQLAELTEEDEMVQWQNYFCSCKKNDRNRVGVAHRKTRL